MRICLANAPWQEDGKWGIRAGCRFPNLMPKRHNSYVPFPYLLAYTAAYLESKGFEVLVIDGVAERSGPESFLAQVDAFQPELLITETATASFHHDVALLGRLKEQNPAILTAVFGPHVSALPGPSLADPAIDFVIIGEPELTAHELAATLCAGGDPGHILGLAYRTGKGIQVNARRPLIKDIDSLPYPKRTGLTMHRYSVPGFPAPVVYMYASRGCPYQCTFCLWEQTVFERGSYRPRQAARIAEEMAFVQKEYGARSIYFDDDTFNIGRPRMLALASEMKKRKLHIPWGMNARADLVDRESLERLMETGLFTIRIGIESGDQQVLDRTRKNLDLEETRKALELTHGLGLQNHVSFVIGLAGETPESIANTAKYIKSIPVDSIQFSVAMPMPGTELYQFAQDNGFLVTNDWKRYSGWEDVVMRTEAMTADEIRDAIIGLRRKAYFSPRFIRRRIGYIRNLKDLVALSAKAGRLLLG